MFLCLYNFAYICDTCHFIAYNTLHNQRIYLARDGLHVNRNGAYVLETALKSFVVDMDMMQITVLKNYILWTCGALLIPI